MTRTSVLRLRPDVLTPRPATTASATRIEKTIHYVLRSPACSPADLRARAVAAAAYQAAPEVTVINSWSLLDDAIRELARLMGIEDEGSTAKLSSDVADTLDTAGAMLSSRGQRTVLRLEERRQCAPTTRPASCLLPTLG